MKVLDMGAGGGYSTELIARVVAPQGIVYGQNPPDLPEKPKTTFEGRLNTPAMKNVVADIRPFDDPVPPGVHTPLLTIRDQNVMRQSLFHLTPSSGFMPDPLRGCVHGRYLWRSSS